MGIFDKIKTGAGLDYLETDKPKKSDPSKPKKAPQIQDKQLRAMEIEIQRIIERLQEIQEKLRIRRGI